MSLIYIECNVCAIVVDDFTERYLRLCISCFTKGEEISGHESDHDYSIVQYNFPLLNLKWNAGEEVGLLEAISECGLGNWADISERVGSKTPEECKQHYFYSYITNPVEELDLIPDSQTFYSSENFPASCLLGSENPARPVPGSSLYREMSGYNAARGDFIIEHLNEAEKILSDMNLLDQQSSDDDDVIEHLRIAILEIYLSSVKERGIRKDLIREHGLINATKATSTLNYFKGKFLKLANLVPKLYPVLTHDQFSRLVEGHSYEMELKHQIQELKEYRSNGLTKNSQTSVYDDMKMRHESNNKRKKKLLLTVDGQDLSIDNVKKLTVMSTPVPSHLRRLSTPLNITGQPDYEYLSEDEKRIASAVRLLPKTFNSIKSTMIDECKKLNGLSLRQARALFKIDVNKIRKVFDFLVKEGFIYTKPK